MSYFLDRDLVRYIRAKLACADALDDLVHRLYLLRWLDEVEDRLLRRLREKLS